MMQVENESGSLGLVHDFSPMAQAIFDAPVPADLVKALNKKSGPWSQVFGDDADETLSAWSPAAPVYTTSDTTALHEGRAVVALLGPNQFLVAGIDCRVQFALPLHSGKNGRKCSRSKRVAMTEPPGYQPASGTATRQIAD